MCYQNSTFDHFLRNNFGKKNLNYSGQNYKNGTYRYTEKKNDLIKYF